MKCALNHGVVGLQRLRRGVRGRACGRVCEFKHKIGARGLRGRLGHRIMIVRMRFQLPLNYERSKEGLIQRSTFK